MNNTLQWHGKHSHDHTRAETSGSCRIASELCLSYLMGGTQL